MPQIPGYSQQVGARGPLGPGAQDIQTGHIVAAGRDIQHALEVREARQERELEEASLVTATGDLQAARSHWSEQLAARQANAPEGAAGFTAGVLKDFDADAKERIGRARTERARQLLESRLADVRFGLQEDAQRFELQSSLRSKHAGLERGVESARTAVNFRPQDYDKILNEQLVAIAGSGLPDEQRAAAAHEAAAAMSGAAVDGLIRRDPYSTLRELNNEKSAVTSIQALSLDQRSRARSAAQSEINRLEAEARARRGEAQDALRTDVQDAFAARMFGMPAQLPARSRYVAAYGPEGADRYNADTKRWGVYDVVGEAAFQPPAEAVATLNRLKPATQEGAALAADTYKAAVELYSQQREALEKNPVDVLLRSDPAIRSAAAAAAQDSAAVPAYLDALRSKQAVLQIPEPKLLTDAQRTALAASMAWDPDAPKRRIATIAAIRQSYGDAFPEVMREVAPKLDGHARVLVNMAPPEAERLDAAFAQKDSFKSLPSGTSGEIRTHLDAELSEFADTLADNPDGIDRFNEHYEAAHLYAQSLVAFGTNTADAARQAAEVVINGQYTYRNGLRIPKVFDDSQVVSALERMKIDLATKGDFTLEVAPRSNREEANEDMRNLIRRDGYWITNESGTGAILRVPHRTGKGEVFRADGSRVEFTFEQLQQTLPAAGAWVGLDIERIDAGMR
jgi:hypothetical protein